MKKLNICRISLFIGVLSACTIFVSSCKKDTPLKQTPDQTQEQTQAQTKPPTVDAEMVTLSGKVVDIESGQVLSGFALDIFGSIPGKKIIREQITTFDDGSFSCELPAGSVNVRVSCDYYNAKNYLIDTDYMRQSRDSMVLFAKITEDMTVEMKVKVRPSVTLRGTVTGPDSEPIGSAKVYASAYTCSLTDENGQFSIPAAPADSDYEILAVSQDSSMASRVKMKAGATETQIQLEPAVSLDGLVTGDDQKPAAKLSFNLMPQLNGNPFYSILTQCVADDEGRFTATNLCPDLNYFVYWHANAKINSNYKAGNATFAAIKDNEISFTVERFIDDYNAPGNIGLSDETKCGKLTNYCLDNEDNILACDSVQKVVRKISPDDKLIAKWSLDFGPEAIDHRPDGTTLVAGENKIAILDKEGKVLKQADHPGKAASGIGFSGNDIFVAVRKGTSFAVYRMDANLENQKMIIKGLRGCCGQMDISAKDGIVYVAANTLFKVLKYDREGQEIARFGKQGREGDDTFKGCCEPKNVCFDTDGNLYTSESGECCIKKFTRDGTFLTMIGKVKGIRGCVRVSIAISNDQSKMYMLDTGRNIVRKIDVPKTIAKTE